MGVFDGLGPNLTRSGSAGERFYTPLGRFGPVYRVADDTTAGRIARDWRAFVSALFLFAFLGAPVIGLAWILIGLGLVMTMAGGEAAVLTPDRSLWLAALFFALCTVGLFVFNRRS